MPGGLLPALAVHLGPTGLWWCHLLVMVGVYALLGLSLNLINGYGRMFSLGHHGFWALGAYTAGALALHLHGPVPGPLLRVLSAVLAMAVAALGSALSKVDLAPFVEQARSYIDAARDRISR